MEEETCAENPGTITNGKIAQTIPERRIITKITILKETTIAPMSAKLNTGNSTWSKK